MELNRLAQSLQCLYFDLADTFARQLKIDTQFLQCVTIAVLQTVAQFNYLALSLA